MRDIDWDSLEREGALAAAEPEPVRERLPSAGKRELSDWRAAIEATGARIVPIRGGRGFRFAPCPACTGGTKDTGWVTQGHTGIIVGCNGGCGYAELVPVLWPPRRRMPSSGPILPKPTAQNRPESTNGGPPRVGQGGRSTPRPDYAPLAETLISGPDPLPLGPEGRRWIERRGLDPDRMEARGWRSIETRAECTGFAGAVRRCGGFLPRDLRGARALLLFAVLDRDGRPLSLRVRGIDPETTPMALGGDTLRLVGVEVADVAGILHVCEGETDAASLLAAGATAVAGLPGCTSCHPEAVELARSLDVRRVVLWPDADDPAHKAFHRLAYLLQADRIAARTVRLPEGADVNDEWRDHPDRLRAAVAAEENTPPERTA